MTLNLKKASAILSLGLSVAFISTTSQAVVSLQIDDNIKVTAINGMSVKKSLLQNKQQEFKLAPGTSVITAKYDRLYKLRRDEHDYLRSGNITVTANLQDNQTYKLTMPNQPEEYSDAKKYIESPTLSIMKGSQVITSEKGQVGSSMLGNVIGSIFGGGSNAINSNSQAIAAVQPAVAVKAHAGTLDQFMQLWLNASEDERSKMRQWITK